MVLKADKDAIKEAVNNNDEESIEIIAKRLNDWLKIDDLLVTYGYGEPGEDILKKVKRIPDNTDDTFNPI
jgi:hypothetical protein